MKYTFNYLIKVSVTASDLDKANELADELVTPAMYDIDNKDSVIIDSVELDTIEEDDD